MNKLHNNFSHLGKDILLEKKITKDLIIDPVMFLYKKSHDDILEISTNINVYDSFIKSDKPVVKIKIESTKMDKGSSVLSSTLNKSNSNSVFKNFFRPGVESVCSKLGVNNIKTFGLALASSAAAVSLAVAFPIPSAAIAAVAAIKGRYVLKDLHVFSESLDKESIMHNISKLKGEYLSKTNSVETENIFKNA